jgi:RNA polymerase sigma-54 factor
MKMSMTGQMRMEQRMKLAPRMIQSMEILQLPLLVLQERIDQELNSNPVLEPVESPIDSSQQQSDDSANEKDLVVNQDNNKVDDFQRLEDLDDDFREYTHRGGPLQVYGRSDESDKKLEAMKNTAAQPISLHEYLVEQWGLVEVEPPVKKAGRLIIDYIDEKGYLSARLEQLHNKEKNDFNLEHLKQALSLIQKLDPPGVGARDLKESLLLQMQQSSDDFDFESRLVAEYMDELLENRLPEIAKKMNCGIERIYEAISRLSKLDTSPGLQVGPASNHPITAEIIVEPNEDGTDYSVRLASDRLPSLRISNFYRKLVKNPKADEKTRQFLKNNIRSAQWFIDAISQRRDTLLRVAKSVVANQKEFFDKGKLFLKPLPMSKIADELGIHIATVSRAVAGKYMQSPQGILPLRRFFAGGIQTEDGESRSWHAVRAKLQQIVEQEDKTKPLSDDEIRKKMAEAGFNNIARRTVAKYRRLLNIPTARFRKKYLGRK